MWGVCRGRTHATITSDTMMAQKSNSSALNKNVSETSVNTAEQIIYTPKNKEKDVFWMRDPKTGYWIPETHFGEPDLVELRQQMLSKKQ